MRLLSRCLEERKSGNVEPEQFNEAVSHLQTKLEELRRTGVVDRTRLKEYEQLVGLLKQAHDGLIVRFASSANAFPFGSSRRKCS